MSIIDDTWREISRRLAERGAGVQLLANAREMYIAGVNVAAAAITVERADEVELRRGAARVERLR